MIAIGAAVNNHGCPNCFLGEYEMTKITGVMRGSLSDRAGIKKGDMLLSVNGHNIKDVLDYRFYICEEKLKIIVARGEDEVSFHIKKDEYDDIGLLFETYLMDEKRRCANNCVFCFIDQNPKGMRETIYFKDDDTRLSFLQGNYITMTNLTETDIDRIVEMKTSPVNISVHTTNPELRVKMLRNKNAGKCLDYLKKLCDGKIDVNAQIVLCKGINDGEELERTMRELYSFENIKSTAIVPAGLTKYREGLCPLELFSKEDSARVIAQVSAFSEKSRKERGTGLFYCSDEFYLRAGLPLPDEAFYDGYPQFENGVGMITSVKTEFERALCTYEGTPVKQELSIATGYAAFDFISALAEKVSARFPQIKINVYKIRNDFFGESVTVAGLITGKDLLNQLSGKPLGQRLLITESMLRHGGDLFLCGTGIDELSEKLNIKITPCPNDGYGIFDNIVGN